MTIEFHLIKILDEKIWTIIQKKQNVFKNLFIKEKIKKYKNKNFDKPKKSIPVCF